MDVSHILNSLNDAQRQAVTADPGNLLVLAGAGSGKTRVLVHRIAWLIEMTGAAPGNLLAVTFTNKAANEMRSRIEELLERPIGGMWVGTFHGLAHRLLRAHWQEAGLPEKFQILDADDQLRLIKRTLQALDLDENKWPAKQCQWYINQQKDEGLRADHLEHYGQDYQRTMIGVYKAYEGACERGGLVDFGELLLRSHELWLKQPGLLAYYQQRFTEILVDEFQDTNAIQYAWLRVLAGTRNHVTAVGDDDQSIYGWRGARIENIQQFTRDFHPATLIRLEQNYRSTSTILKAANHLIANNSGRLGKELWTDGMEGEPIAVYAAFNEQDEARFICDQIQQWAKRGRRREEIVVLYRSNAQSRELEEALLRTEVPYRIYGGFRFYERLEIRNAVGYLRLIASRDDDAAFERVINTPVRGIGNVTLELIRNLARSEGCSLWQAARQAVTRGQLPGRAAQNVQDFMRLIDLLEEYAATHELHLSADYVIRQSGLIQHHEKEGGEKARSRLENLEELVNAAGAFVPDATPDGEKPTPLETLGAFLDRAALDAGDTQADDYEDAVQLMTLHSAKGLEYPFVIIAGLEEGLFPHKMSADSLSGLEEERRLCYVGLTRAREKLLLCHAESRRLHGEEHLTRPSRFLKEIPAELRQEVRMKGQVSRSFAVGERGAGESWGRRDVSTRADLAQEPQGLSLSLGQRVRHPTFGEGVVLNSEGRGSNARVQINFDGVGGKWLVMAYAKLEAI
ncbi:MAG: DNA helicase II [Pseudomonadales bacterium]|jgi:DNA helicase-2/ATP-dependent DNA helicase PcrA|nr:DNA helicase II [Pseudomonadales bacterium]